jgi:hypothetical protein
MDEKVAPYQVLRRSRQEEIARPVQIHPEQNLKSKCENESREAANLTPAGNAVAWRFLVDYPLSGNTPILGTTDIVQHLQHMGSANPLILNVSLWKTPQRPRCRGPSSRKSSHN